MVHTISILRDVTITKAVFNGDATREEQWLSEEEGRISKSIKGSMA
jgi:hypothetical protein